MMDKKQITTLIRTLYINRNNKGIKTDFGKTLLIGGSKPYPNAMLIASEFASLSGVGFVAMSVPEEIYPIIASRMSPTAIFEIFKTENDAFLLKDNLDILQHVFKTYSSILIGNGMKICRENYDFIAYLIKNYEGNLIIDASGIKLLSLYNINILEDKNFNSHILFTPHLGEAKSLLQSDIISRNPLDYLEYAIHFATKYKVNLLLKSTSSLLIDETGKSLAADSPCTATLGKAGSGDGLAGYLAGILAYGEKYFHYNDLVLFSDWIIHEGAKNAGEKYSTGLTSILSVPKELSDIIIKERHDFHE